MNFKIILLGSAFLVQIILFGCENCDTADPMVTSYITLKVVDSAGKNLVNSFNGPNYPDSVRASVKDKSAIQFEILERPGLTETQFICMPSFNETGQTELYLHLNHQDTDTLLINYKPVEQDCGGAYYVYTGFSFNGKRISNEGVLELVK
ncbi:hypothetical protein L0657_15970 [Dyadobacter sp. CY345]|uniref:hypothetical protein n=1 Tax=Dyadobacter sp. CY345 TaxID=2909335 RepID=UPI001F298B7E|nr:hypothetical protein [Dyadobacter sp. CY345]MCF2445460.1 hypothetical protein [Dyadobacter sp. CY345]